MFNDPKLSANQLNRLDVEKYRKMDKSSVSVLLDNVRSAINVGSIFRTCDAFNVEKIYLSGITACPPNKEILKSALGATESVAWEYVRDPLELLKELKEQSMLDIICVEQTLNSTKLHEFLPDKDKKYVLVLGNEIDGINQQIINLANTTVEIPQFGTKHSLNVAVTAGIVLWDWYSKNYLNITSV